MTVLRVIDFETTGMEPPAEVVEVGYCDLVQTEHGWDIEPPVSFLCGVAAIPPECRAVHHISAADVVGMPPFDAVHLVEHSDHCAVSGNYEAGLRIIKEAGRRG